MGKDQTAIAAEPVGATVASAQAAAATAPASVPQPQGAFYRKYSEKWPNCENIDCLTMSRGQFERACLKDQNCTGFSFPTNFTTAGYGCLKQCGAREFGGFVD